MSSTPQYITLTDDNQILAEATIRSATHRPSIHADLHVEAGHLPVGTRTRLVDAVLDVTAAEPGTHLQVTLPAGDGEILDRLRQRYEDLQIHPREPAASPPAPFDKRRPARSIPKQSGRKACEVSMPRETSAGGRPVDEWALLS